MSGVWASIGSNLFMAEKTCVLHPYHALQYESGTQKDLWNPLAKTNPIAKKQVPTMPVVVPAANMPKSDE